MLGIDDWDFLWQGQYYFARPVPLLKGTRLDVVAYYDNSADNPFNPHRPPRRVRFGWPRKGSPSIMRRSGVKAGGGPSRIMSDADLHRAR
jgi:hypothetical protein